MTKAISIEAIEKATGKTWDEWLKFFDRIGAKDMTHKEIAEKVYEEGTPGWWSQNVTVAYEQHIGRRVPGQDNDGTFTANASKTIDSSMDKALDAWVDLVGGQKEFNRIKVSGEPRVTKTEKWRNWRCDLADGSKVVVGIYQKSPEKSGLGLAHEKLADAEEVDRWRIFWKEILSNL